MSQSNTLKKSLGPLMIWGLGVGYVISGDYFGWNLGLPEGGPLGLLAATILVTIMYVTFVLSYAELSCAMPKAGGAFVYTTQALGPFWGFLGGMAQWVEFVFAPPAIAIAIGQYFGLYVPGVSPILIAFLAYLVFTGMNIYGVRQSAIFELFITVLAVGELLIFAGVTMPHFSWESFSHNGLPNGWSGAFAAIPFAIWFYLAIEGIANVAEESRNPQKDISWGFTAAMVTLVVLALLTFFSAVGVSGWEAVVYLPSGELSDTPLPMALRQVVGESGFLYHLLITVGLFGLIASFNGIILAAGRATFEFGRVGYAPKLLGTTLPNRQTPAVALIVNLAVGTLAILTGKTGTIITIAVFGAVTLYMISMVAFFSLRKKQPDLPRPFRTPLYPWIPATALILAVVCMASLFYYNLEVGLIYLAILFVSYVWYYLFIPKKIRQGSLQA